MMKNCKSVQTFNKTLLFSISCLCQVYFCIVISNWNQIVMALIKITYNLHDTISKKGIFTVLYNMIVTSLQVTIYPLIINNTIYIPYFCCSIFKRQKTEILWRGYVVCPSTCHAHFTQQLLSTSSWKEHP